MVIKLEKMSYLYHQTFPDLLPLDDAFRDVDVI